jgi:hypothetical protein
MKTKIIKYLFSGILIMLYGAISCTDYLDREPQSMISEKDAFKNFFNFQGYVEEMYMCIPDISKCNWVADFNWGEDEIFTFGNGNMYLNPNMDRGNFRHYIGNGNFFLDRNGSATSTDRMQKDIWRLSWACLRKVNMGIEALDKGMMVDATQDERDIVAGQLYFFRGWFHFNLTNYWGGMPYIDKVLPSDEKLTLPRETYRECALKMAADFRKAADLLPINWDDTDPGRRTLNQNALRVNKIWALAYLGKTYLWAGSPLMTHGANGPKTYDAEMCKNSAAAFGELLNLVESGQTQYALVNFAQYSSLFFTIQQNWLMPGGTEAIMRGPTFGADGRWRQNQSYLPTGMTGGDQICLSPPANYVNYYGMENGLPLKDPESGFNPTQPWKGRDPRFYTDIIFDGLRIVKGTIPADFENAYRYANLHTGGSYVEDERTSSRTGYLVRKFITLGMNRFDNEGDYSYNSHLALTWVRLADVYLMYAEAAAQGFGSPNGKDSRVALTAVDAINVVRKRAGVANVNAKYLTSLDAFMGEVRRERAVELSFEAHRFNDLRRWLLLTEYPYNIKTCQEFNRAAPLNPAADPKEARVVNFEERTILTRQLDSKHYWLPIKDADVYLYHEFSQNPGW